MNFAKRRIYRNFLFVLLMLTFPLIAGDGWKQELNQLNQQIEVLTDEKEKLEASAERNENDAMRWQFRNETSLDARMAWERAEKQREAVKQLELQINQLKEKRALLIRENT